MTSCKLSEKTPRLQSDIEQISTGSQTRWRRRATATPLLLPALPTELSLCWFVFHKSNADILLRANCRLIHGWRCTETQEDFNDFNDVFWLSQLRCWGKKNPKEPQTEKPPLCLSGHGESRSLCSLRFMALNDLKLTTDGGRMMENRKMPNNEPWN